MPWLKKLEQYISGFFSLINKYICIFRKNLSEKKRWKEAAGQL